MSTNSKGIMAQIRERLSQGKCSREIIALGYRPGTVYKVQRGMRKESTGLSQGLIQVATASHHVPDQPEAPNWWPSVDDLFVEDEPLALLGLLDHDFPQLSEKVESLSGGIVKLRDESASLRLQLGQAQARIRELEIEVDQAQALMEGVKALESREADLKRDMVTLGQVVKSILEQQPQPQTVFEQMVQDSNIRELHDQILGQRIE